ncbi:uncharacterized protein LOC144434825 [Glandiceps talaboti]
MVLHESSGNAVPVVVRNGQFYKRVRNTGCDSLQLLTEQEVKTILTADGGYRTAIVINGQLPGPPIIVKNGTEVVVNVKNSLLMEGITIHWHGMLQHNTPWMDGVGTVSQCPINPGETFTYRFLATPPGTHWYHSHLGTERTDGFYGALIVLGSYTFENMVSPTKKFDGDFIMLVSDWMREPSIDIYNRIHRTMQRFTPGFDDTEQCFFQTNQLDGAVIGHTPFISGLLNGKGRHYNSTNQVENDIIPIEWFNVKPHLYYRFRVISASMMYAFRISIDSHDLVLSATDSNPIVPTPVQSVVVHSGERVDFYIHAKQPIKNYWIRGETLEIENRVGGAVTAGHVEAVLHYDKSPLTEPTSQPDLCTQSNPCTVVNCPYRYYPSNTFTRCIPISDLKAHKGTPPPRIPNDMSNFQEIFMNFHLTGSGRLTPSVNGRHFVPPSTPLMILPKGELSDYMTICDEKVCDTDHCDCTHYVELTMGNVIQIVLYNIRIGELIQAAAHPVHIHGHHFYVLKTGYGLYDRETGNFVGENTDIDCGNNPQCNIGKWNDPTWKGDKIPGLNLENPPLKDTIIVPVGGYVVVRFVADNPGWWFVHCHIEDHQIQGMALMLKEGDVTEMMNPPKDFKTCGNFWWSETEFRDKLEGVLGGIGETKDSLRVLQINPVTAQLPLDQNKECVDEEDYHIVLGVAIAEAVLNIVLLLACCYCCLQYKHRSAYTRI